jgi:ATP-dependent Clp protease adaptor protein ClpS
MPKSDHAVIDVPETVDPPPPKVRRETKPDTSTRPKRLPPHAVVLQNDDRHSFPYVIEVLRRICGHSKTKAFLLTAKIHLTGRGIVWTGSKEVAELKRDQIRGFGPDIYAMRPVNFPLGVTIEPMPE